MVQLFLAHFAPDPLLHRRPDKDPQQLCFLVPKHEVRASAYKI